MHTIFLPFIKEQIKNGVKSSDIYQTLKNVYDSNLLQRDIYDIRCEQKRGNDQVTSSTSRIPLSNDWERLHNYLMKEVPHAIPYHSLYISRYDCSYKFCGLSTKESVKIKDSLASNHMVFNALDDDDERIEWISQKLNWDD